MMCLDCVIGVIESMTGQNFPDMAGCCSAGGLASEFAKFQRSLAAEYLMWQSKDEL